MAKVPRSLNLGPLARIAVIVDYYNCREACSIISDVWVENYYFETGIRDEGQLVVWMLVARSFSQTDTLSHIIEDAVWYSKKKLQICLGIPEMVIGKSVPPLDEVCAANGQTQTRYMRSEFL
jgi:hypothetical protein